MARRKRKNASEETSKADLRHRVAGMLMVSAESKRMLADIHADTIVHAASEIAARLQRDGRVLVCGNGGSAADAQHLAAELVGRYQKTRRALPAIALTADSSIITCIANDFGYQSVFSRQVEALGAAGDILIGISTSGESRNILNALEIAVRNKLFTIALTGAGGGMCGAFADILLDVPAISTPRIQECHCAVIHILCELVELLLFEEK